MKQKPNTSMLKQDGNYRAKCKLMEHKIWLLEAALGECLPFVKSYLGGDHPIVNNAKSAIDIQVKPG